MGAPAYENTYPTTAWMWERKVLTDESLIDDISRNKLKLINGG
jgi:hypothetical protein